MKETPDGRMGAIVQFWYDNEDIEKFDGNYPTAFGRTYWLNHSPGI